MVSELDRFYELDDDKTVQEGDYVDHGARRGKGLTRCRSTIGERISDLRKGQYEHYIFYRPLSEKKVSNTCSCDINQLMMGGCICGKD